MSSSCNLRWGERETRIFVKLYLSHECLWSQSHAEYRSKFHRDEAVKDIIEKFAKLANILLDAYSVKRKIKNLKSTYLQEVLKMVKKRSAHKSPYIPRLKWFNDFHRCFSGSKMKDKDGEPSDVDGEDDTGNMTQEIWLDMPNPTENKAKDEHTNEDPFESDNYLLLLKQEPDDHPVKQYQAPIRKRKIKKQRVSSDDSDYLVHHQSNRTDRYNRDSKERVSIAKEDEFDIYGKFIASQLREMGLHKALRVQLKIQTIVSEARMESLSGDEP